MTRVRIAVPTHDGRITTECMLGVVDSWGKLPCALDVVRGSFLPRSRDLIIARFLADAESSHLLCVDSDMAWHAGHLAALLEMETDFAFGQYVAKREPPTAQASGPLGEVALPNGVTAREYERCGAGFVLLRRAAVEAMVSCFAATESYIDPAGRELVGLWQTSGRIERGGQVVAEGEDYAFCRRWRDTVGGRIFTRPDMWLGHVGEKVWRSDATA